jgi:hypothetical protein
VLRDFLPDELFHLSSNCPLAARARATNTILRMPIRTVLITAFQAM